MKVVLDTNVFASGVFLGGCRVATLVAAPPLSVPASRDPDDDKFLACAVAARAEVLVSGDRDLLAVSPYRRVSVLRPRDFVNAFL